jgi:glycosyltransferase involved in cell wall biosynthesis
MISIIIPCYNSEKTLSETLDSVLLQNYEEWEAIVVNDGSPDNLEKIALEYVNKDSRFKYIKKENGGLATARNYGIERATGKYILPLDSDNKVRPDFGKTAIALMDQDQTVDVVYGDAMYFGEKSGIWKVGKFDKYRMLEHNYIDACAIIKKSVFDKIGGYDSNLPYQGHEDWDFWLRCIKHNIQFYYLEEITFDYRVASNSMIRRFNDNMVQENINYLRNKNQEVFFSAFEELYIIAKNKKFNETEKNENLKSLIKKVIKKIF